jgi:CRP-like cAMP-binding protein
MISPEVLRRFPFFGWIEAEDLRAIAMISEEVPIEKDTTIFEECASADSLYFLISGSVDLFFSVRAETGPAGQKEYYSGSINPGEAFGVSALIDPYRYTTTARASAPVQALRVDAIALRQLLENKPRLGVRLMGQIARVAMERLNAARVQLAAAWS